MILWLQYQDFCLIIVVNGRNVHSMFISPGTLIDQGKDKTYEELLAVRNELIKEIEDFEKEKGANHIRVYTMPSKELIYENNLKYLGKICLLISDKFKSEKLT